jgi:hypothetical protein
MRHGVFDPRKLGVVLAIACCFVPQASAKGALALCGTGACVQIGSEGNSPVRWLADAYESHVAATAPAPFFKLRFAGGSDVLAYWVPSAGVLRLQPRGGNWWVRPSADEAAVLAQASATLRPFPAPRRMTVTVDDFVVPRGGSTYLRLFTTGTPMANPPHVRRWLAIDWWGGKTPWTDGLWGFMSVSRTGPYLKRDGDIVRIRPRIADRIRHRLPLAPSG